VSSEVFDRYGAYYDLLYRDKDYRAEVEYVARTLRSAAPKTKTLLEFGSGTGRHGRLFASRGFQVVGVERSKSMVEVAQTAPSPAGAGTFDCTQGDIRTVKLDRAFDAVIALFHVVSYQTGDEEIARTFANASDHLNPGGLFLFDVWHGPAVLHQGPSIRTKRVADAHTRLTRIANPELHAENHIVTVRYTINVESIRDNRTETFQEEHQMRYFFPNEIESLADENQFKIERCEEFVTSQAASEKTWGVCYLLRKIG
jgi:SAM-dependent methyltransferase